MGLVKCEDCGYAVSTFAGACPQCGRRGWAVAWRLSKRATSILILTVALFVTVLAFKLLGADKLTAARLLPPLFGAAAGVCFTARDHERNDRLGAVVIGALVALAAVGAVAPRGTIAIGILGGSIGGGTASLALAMRRTFGKRRNLFLRALGRCPKHLSKRGRVIRAAGILLMPLVVGFMVYMSGLRLDPYSLRGLGAMFLTISVPLYLLSILQHSFGTEGGGDSPSGAEQEPSRRT